MELETEWKTVRVSGQEDMRIYVAKPFEKTKSVPAVIVLQEAFGVNGHIRNVTERIARLGYIAVAPELFHRTAPGFEGSYGDIEKVRGHIQAVTDENLAADLRVTYEMLMNDPQLDKLKVAAVGYCMGGKAAFLANAIMPLSCAVSYYGGGIADRLLPQAREQHGPIMLFWGGKDGHVGPKQHYAVAEALRQADKNFVDVEFASADHGFFCDERKSYDPTAAEASWALMTTFLRQNFT